VLLQASSPKINSMTSVTAVRKVIPDASQQNGAGSGFSFMGSQGQGQSQGVSKNDAFSFIKDEVKASSTKR
jgi:hypothetical protein